MHEIVTYDKSLKFKDYLTLGDHGRTGVFMKTDNCDVLRDKVLAGWSFEETRGGFWLRAPDISVCDVTEPFRLYQFGDPASNLACFRLLHELKRSGEMESMLSHEVNGNGNYSNLEFYISEGRVLEGEVRIGGSDNRIEQLKKDFLTRVASMAAWERYCREAEDYLGQTRNVPVVKRSIECLGNKSAEMVRYLTQINDIIYPKKNWFGYEMLTDVVEQLPNFDVMIFIPTGCYKYMSSFLRDEFVDKIMLWEVHIDRHENRTSKMLAKDLKDKRCLIVDKSYTGNTLNVMADLVKGEGGIPIRFGLFPKSRLGINNSDYVLLLDRVFESVKMELDDNWPERYYKKVLSGNRISAK